MNSENPNSDTENKNESLDAFLKVFYSIPTGMIITDDKRVYIRVNKKFSEMFGYGEEEVVGLTSVQIGVLDQAESDRISGIIKEKGEVKNETVKCHSKNGKITYAIISLEIIEIASKKYFVTSFLDITKIKEQQDIIEYQNHEIVNSINYAKRIQSALLEEPNNIYSVLPNSFVLFKPKDIVSGDFYYFKKINKLVYIAAADCTGHGVPGALMSMICIEKMDAAFNNSFDTSEILSKVNKSIRYSLRQTDSQESTRDGMDIALCSIDTENLIVSYAGANRPLWLIRKENSEIIEIKATKKAIGGFTESDQHFESHKLQLQKGDRFYIFSDGYADTFGGQNAKKLTTKKFKEILISIQTKTMKEQEEFLNSFIETWKNKIEQVDDILIIGVEF